MEILQLNSKQLTSVKNYLLLDILPVARKGSSVFTANIVDRLSSVAVFWLIARIYGPFFYGQATTIFTICGLIDIIFQWGFPVFIQRETARSNAQIKKYIYKLVNIRITTFLVFIIIPVLYFSFIATSKVNFGSVGIITAAVFVNSVSQILVSYFYGLGSGAFVLKSVIYSRLLFLLSFIPVFIKSIPPEFILILFLIVYICQSVLLINKFGFSSTFFKEETGKDNRGLAKKIINECAPIVITSALVTFYDKIDVMIISNMRGYDEVAFYNIAYNIYKLPLIGFSIFFTPLFTAYSRKFHEKSLNYKESIRFGSVVFSISLITSFVLYASSGPVIEAVYGRGFSAAAEVLKYLSFSFIFLALNNYTNLLINSMNLNKENVKVFIGSLLINVVLNIVLVRKNGISGAAFATLITEMSVLVFQFFLIKKKLNIRYKFN